MQSTAANVMEHGATMTHSDKDPFS